MFHCFLFKKQAVVRWCKPSSIGIVLITKFAMPPWWILVTCGLNLLFSQTLELFNQHRFIGAKLKQNKIGLGGVFSPSLNLYSWKTEEMLVIVATRTCFSKTFMGCGAVSNWSFSFSWRLSRDVASPPWQFYPTVAGSIIGVSISRIDRSCLGDDYVANAGIVQALSTGGSLTSNLNLVKAGFKQSSAAIDQVEQKRALRVVGLPVSVSLGALTTRFMEH
jgi:hypothetical protein